MKKHWLKIKGTSLKIKEQWKQLSKYLEKYPESKITVYNSDNSLIDKYFCLECSQQYNDLDLDVNSSSSKSLQWYKRKPNNITESKIDFYKLSGIYGI